MDLRRSALIDRALGAYELDDLAAPSTDAEAKAFHDVTTKFGPACRGTWGMSRTLDKSMRQRNPACSAAEAEQQCERERDPRVTPFQFLICLVVLSVLSESEARTLIDLLVAMLLGDDLRLSAASAGCSRKVLYQVFFRELRDQMFVGHQPPASTKKEDMPNENPYHWTIRWAVTVGIPGALRGAVRQFAQMDALNFRFEMLPAAGAKRPRVDSDDERKPGGEQSKKKNKRKGKKQPTKVCTPWLNSCCGYDADHDGKDGDEHVRFCHSVDSEERLRELQKKLPKRLPKPFAVYAEVLKKQKVKAE